MIFALVTPLAVLACRDLLGIADQTTVAGDGGGGDAMFDAAPETTPCGTLTALFPTGVVTAVAGDDTAVYWVESIESQASNIYGWDTTNGQVSVADADVPPQDIRVDSQYVYWNAWDVYNSAPQNNAALRAWSRTTHKTTSLPLGNLGAGELAISGTNAYFGDWFMPSGGIYRASVPFVDGGTIDTLASGINSSFHIVALGDRLFFDQNAAPNGQGETVWSLGLDAGTLVNLQDAGNVVDDMAASSKHVYWVTGPENTILRDDGTSYSVDEPVDLVVDAADQFIYVVSTAQGGDLFRIDVADQTQTTCKHFDQVDGLAITPTRLYIAAKASDTSGILYQLVF